ncbi:MAG TPA: hypothetical protein VFY73_26190 [Ideonella sp.]|uniref:hypothetical protein n=1 Tax=Ideonella sp. TaxID=1929293 RepID=UPI002E31852A|nr:hypothetical protein [Ideonella sp.]HEX5687521.1 hypothetical protein [Ideonella sp.]
MNNTACPHGPASWAKPLLLGVVAISLVSGVLGGLARLGVAPSSIDGAVWLNHALLWHAGLMICGFLGTVIGIERAVAVKRPMAFLAPLLSGAAGLCFIAGYAMLASALLVAAASLFVAVNVVIVRRQRAAHTVLLLVAALAWLIGNLHFAFDATSPATLSWWFSFLVLTIAAERLEMTRLMRRHPAAQPSFFAAVALLLAGAAASAVSPVGGGVLFGTALTLLATWLVVFDIARRTVFAAGLPRYMAACLLGGYLWLAVAGVAWAAMVLGAPTRDIAWHALGLGFVISMVMGHAPVILPAVARVKLLFGRPFYVPLLALHLSLALRLGPGAFDTTLRAAGASMNALTLVWFAATVVGGIAAWRWLHRGPVVTPLKEKPR